MTILTISGRVQKPQAFRQYLVISPGHLTGFLLLQPSVAPIYWYHQKLLTTFCIRQVKSHVIVSIPSSFFMSESKDICKVSCLSGKHQGIELIKMLVGRICTIGRAATVRTFWKTSKTNRFKNKKIINLRTWSKICKWCKWFRWFEERIWDKYYSSNLSAF